MKERDNIVYRKIDREIDERKRERERVCVCVRERERERERERKGDKYENQSLLFFYLNIFDQLRGIKK